MFLIAISSVLMINALYREVKTSYESLPVLYKIGKKAYEYGKYGYDYALQLTKYLREHPSMKYDDL